MMGARRLARAALVLSLGGTAAAGALAGLGVLLPFAPSLPLWGCGVLLATQSTALVLSAPVRTSTLGRTALAWSSCTLLGLSVALLALLPPHTPRTSCGIDSSQDTCVTSSVPDHTAPRTFPRLVVCPSQHDWGIGDEGFASTVLRAIDEDEHTARSGGT